MRTRSSSPVVGLPASAPEVGAGVDPLTLAAGGRRLTLTNVVVVQDESGTDC